MERSLSIAIVGAGLGGLTAAVALQQRGFANVTLFEKAPELGEIGAGLSIGANAHLVLNDLGLHDVLDGYAKGSTTWGTLDWQTGDRIKFRERTLEEVVETEGALIRHIHRADLHKALEDAFDKSGEALKLDHDLADITQDAEGVTLRFTNGASYRFDAVIGCDGLKSKVRDCAFAPDPPQFTGFVVWRGLTHTADVPGLDLVPHFASYPAEGQLFTRYPVRHGRQINWVANAIREDAPGTESWTQRVPVSEVLENFGDWDEDVVRIIEAAPGGTCNRWDLHSRQPLDSWVAGRITLLGDAAHPMTPFYGMGAGMAIEDACILARCFEAEGSNYPAAFGRYEKARLARANRFHMQSLERGKMYMSADPKNRVADAKAGMEDAFTYNAVTVAI